jgi:hypothetical protein
MSWLSLGVLPFVIPIDFKGENQPKNIVKSHLISKKIA